MLTVNKQEKGFTLIELSIVLVIIGLIVGGILVGQDMINAARSRATVAQIEKYNSAVNVFREKYGAIPGDYSNAVTNIGVATGHNGNGDGYIYQAAGVPAAAPTAINLLSEYVYFWEHLGKASLIDGVFTGDNTATVVGAGGNFASPKTGAGGIMAFTYTDGLNYWHLGLVSAAASTVVTVGNILTPVQAQSIDTKMDDGAPATGIVKAIGNATIDATASVGAVGSNSCLFTGGTTYLLSNLAQACQLRIRMN